MLTCYLVCDSRPHLCRGEVVERVKPRSFLFVPGCEPRKIAKARTVVADAILLDLEDAVPEAEKEQARSMVAEALAAGGWGSKRIGVRINPPSSPHAVADLRAVLGHDVDWLFVPKVEDGRDLEFVADHLETARAAERISVAAILESAIGVLHAAAIAATEARLDALMFGSGDYCADLGIRESLNRAELDYARSHVALVAASRRLLAIDTPFYQDIHNLDAALRDAQRARQLGYHAKGAIHPTHVPMIHEAFCPDEADVAWARQVVDAHRSGMAKGHAASLAGGTMVDRPVVLQARTILVAAGEEQNC